MEHPRGRSIRTEQNRPNGRTKHVVEGKHRRYGVVLRRATRSATRAAVASPAARMDSNNSNIGGQCPGSGSTADTPSYVFDMNECAPHAWTIPLQQFPPVHHFSASTYSPNRYYRQPYPPAEQGQGSGHYVNQQGGSQLDGELGSTDVHAEPDVQEVDGSQIPQLQGKKKGLARRGKAYEIEEDRVLCSAWLNISLDAVTGTNQDKATFYQRMHRYFLENYDMNSKRSENSIQQRWSTISRSVSKFCAILGKIERLNQSGKNFQDRVNDAIKEYQEKEPWHFQHCWEMLRDEPKWNDRVLDVNKPARSNAKQDGTFDGRDTEPQLAQDVSSPLPRPEGRDSVKRRRGSKMAETSSSSVAVDMLQKMHDRGQQMDELDSKRSEEMINLEKAKFEMQQKQWQAKFDMIQESNRLQRELQREMTEAQLKVQMELMDVERRKADSQIMFTDVSKLTYPLREWVLRKQMEILARDGIDISTSSERTKDN